MKKMSAAILLNVNFYCGALKCAHVLFEETGILIQHILQDPVAYAVYMIQLL